MNTRGLWIALAITCAASPDAAADNVAKADALFSEGKALLATDLHQACAKFEESLTYNSQAIGTLMNVALCDEKLGRIASALAKFTEARDRAKEQELEAHFDAAEQHIAALAPRLPHLIVTFATPPVPGTKIVIHDRVIPQAALANLPIDPGEHVVVVSAPGYLPHQTTVTVAEAERRQVTIPALARSVTVNSSQRTIGKITAATGIAAVGTGIALIVIARGRYDAQFTSGECRELASGTLQCDPDGYGATNSALTLGRVGIVIGGVGIAAVAAGTYLWLRGPKGSAERRVSVVPQLGPSGGGFVAVGRF